MIKLDTLNNYVLFTEENGDAQAIGKLQLTYKIEDEDITFFVLKEGNKKIYTVPFFSAKIDNLSVDGIVYSKEDLPVALATIFLPPSGSGSSGEVTPSDIAYLQQQINVNKTNTGKAYVLATYESEYLTLTTLNGVQTKLYIPYFDSAQYYLKSQIDNLLTTINNTINNKADITNVYTKEEINNIIDDLNIDPDDIVQIENDIEDLKAGTISKVVYTALDGKLAVTDYRGNVTNYTIPYFNSANYYTKTQADSAISTAVGNLNTLIQTKFGDYYTKSQTYSKTEVDSKIASIPTFDSSQYYTKTQTDTALNLKADKSTTYTKTDVDAKLTEYAKISNVYTKTQTDSLLSSKANTADVYNKTQVYTKTEVDGLLTGKVNTGDIYNKIEIDDKVGDLQDQINDLGNLDNYYTKTEVDTKLSTKADSSSVYTKTQTDTLLSSKANTADVYTKTQTYTQTEVNNLLADKANQSTTYTKTEVDTKLNQKADITNVYTKSQTYTQAEVDAKIVNLEGDINTVDAKFSNYYTKTESDTKYATKNTYTTVSVSSTSQACNFSTYDYFHLNLSGSNNSLTITASNLSEYGKAYYITINNNRSTDVEILGLTTITSENPVILAGGTCEVSVMKWGDNTIKATFIVSQ